jgi:hypothetical protein
MVALSRVGNEGWRLGFAIHVPLLSISVIIFHPSVLQLADLVEFFECHQLLLEVLVVKFFEIIISKYLVVLKPLLEKLTDLLGSEFTILECIGSVLGRSIKLVFFMFDHLDSSLEKSIFSGLPNDSLFESGEFMDALLVGV